MGKFYAVCPYCGAERCDCQKIDLQPDKITETDVIAPARAIVAAMKKVIDEKTGKFKDPKIAADYDSWLAERRIYMV